MSNLPPGVTDSMIPGNRPEDLAEEAFWNEVADKMDKEGIKQEQIDSIFEGGDSNLSWVTKTLEIVRMIAYQWGYNEGQAEAQMSISNDEMHVSELLDAWMETKKRKKVTIRQYLKQQGLIRKHLKQGTIEYERRGRSIENADEIYSDESGNRVMLGTYVVFGYPETQDARDKATAEVIEITEADSDYDDDLGRGVTYPAKATIKFVFDGETETVSSSYSHLSPLAKYWEIEGVEQGVWEFGDITVVDQESCEHKFVHQRSVSGRQHDGQDVVLDIERCMRCGLEQAD